MGYLYVKRKIESTPFFTLGIETSCDETAAAVVSGEGEILSNIVASSLAQHKRYGGVVPEIAVRYHVEVISRVVDSALKEAKVGLGDIGLIAVTYGPGLVGALLAGISYAKALSFAHPGRVIPLIGVNHLEAHLHAALLNKRGGTMRIFPFIGLVVSGGHTALVLARDINRYELLGETRDDAVGEAFDKVAKLLGLGYPGGPVIDRLSQGGLGFARSAVRFPRPYLQGNYDFSFSGIKTAVLYYLKREKGKCGGLVRTKEIAASFQDACVSVLVEKAIGACKKNHIMRLVVGGGVSANSQLRRSLTQGAKLEGIELILPELKFSLDNAAMVAALGAQLYKRGERSNFELSAEPSLGWREM